MFISTRLGVVAALAAIMFPRFTAAQTPRWVQSRPLAYPFNFDYLRSDAAVLPDGGAWWATPDTLPHNQGMQGHASLQLLRLTPSGGIRSQRLIKGDVTLQNVVSAPDGGLALNGVYFDSIVFDPQHRLTQLPTSGNGQHFVARLDSAGQVQWLRPVRGGQGSETAQQGPPAFDARGNLWVPNGDFIASYLTRFNTAGDSVQSIVQQQVRVASSIAFAPDGTIYAAGSCPDLGASFGGTPGPAPFSYTAYVACYAPTGQLQWVRYVEDITCATPQVATRDNGGVYFTSALWGAPTFGSFTAAGPAWNSDFFLTRLDRATGSFLWLREVPQLTTGYAELAMVKSLAVDAGGNAWLLQHQAGTIQWNSTSTTSVGGQPGSSSGVLLLAYDVQGNLRTAFSSNGGFVRAHGLSIDPLTNRGVLTGLSVQAGASLGAMALPSAGQGAPRPFAVSFDAVMTPLATGAETSGFTSVTVVPNPVTDNPTLTVVGLPAGPVAVSLLDASGRLVLKTNLTSRAAGEEIRLALPAALSGGLYALRCQTSTGLMTQRIAVSR